jgi:S1-C subfamily serine protease
MLDLRGNVIGIVTAKLVGVGVENVGYAISISTVDLYLATLEAGQSVYQ